MAIADIAIAAAFIKEMSGVDVSSYSVVNREGSIKFIAQRGPDDPDMVAQIITKRLGVTKDYICHDGIEYWWDLPNQRLMLFIVTGSDTTTFGLLDFKAR